MSESTSHWRVDAVPVSVKIGPFSNQPVRPDLPLRTPQARVLAALAPADPSDPVSEWPLVTRAQLRCKMGFSPTHTMNRLLNGQNDRPGSKHTNPGLIPLGLIEVVVLNIEGVDEVNLRITKKGIQCLSLHDEKKK